MILTVRMSRLGFTTVSWFRHCLSSSRSWPAQECKVRITLVHPNPGLKGVVHWTAAISLFFTNHLSSPWMVVRGCVGSWKSDVVVLCGSRWTPLQCTVSKKPLFCFSGDLVKFPKLQEHGRKDMDARWERTGGRDGWIHMVFEAYSVIDRAVDRFNVLPRDVRVRTVYCT